MPKITFTQENLLEGNKLDAAWYKLKVVSVAEGPGTKDPSSTTYTLDFIVEGGKFAGTPIKHWLSDKMMKNVVEFITCFVTKTEPGKEYEMSETVGRFIMGYIQYDDARASNSIQAFKKVA